MYRDPLAGPIGVNLCSALPSAIVATIIATARVPIGLRQLDRRHVKQQFSRVCHRVR